METKAVVYDTWDDLVFENRNKQYGAYALRKQYNNQVLLGFGISVALIAILLFLPSGAKPEIVPVIELPPIEILPPPEIIRNPPPPARQLPRDPVPQERVVNTNTNTVPIITSDPVETTPVDVTYVEPVITDNGGTSTGVDTGTGTTPGTSTDIDLAGEFVFVEVMPVYEGGMEALYKFIGKQIRYPGTARRMGVEGIVFVEFVIRGDGTVDDVKVARGIHPDCDKEAVRVISMMKGWKGGIQSGYPVSVRMTLPIRFQLR